MAKQLAFTDEARKKLKNGIDVMANAVKTTPGVDDAGGWVYTQATGNVKVNLNAYSSY